MSARINWDSEAIQDLMTTELNSLAVNNGALSSEFDNSSDSNFMFADFEVNVDFGLAPTADKTIDLYLIQAIDGTNYGDGAGGASPVTPGNAY
ncbi:hypothetical protein C4588_07175, partial [Candidatus Parcubacteria bacterium]